MTDQVTKPAEAALPSDAGRPAPITMAVDASATAWLNNTIETTSLMPAATWARGKSPQVQRENPALPPFSRPALRDVRCGASRAKRVLDSVTGV